MQRSMLPKILFGLIAGLTATIVLSVLIYLKASTGLLPQLNTIALLVNLGNQYLFLPSTPATGWTLHFLIGTVLWGILFALVTDHIPPANQTVKGIGFGVVAWLLMMLVVMPLAGAGWFGQQLGIDVAIVTLVLHIIFGAVLGYVYGIFSGQNRTRALATRPGTP